MDIKPFQAVQLLLENRDLKASLVFEDYKIAGVDEKEISILVFEKFYLRNSSTATLTVIADNFSGVPIVKCISAGNGQGILDMDLGAGKSFLKPVRKILEPHIIEITQES